MTLQSYKKDDDYRGMALAYLDDSTLGGVAGTITKLVDALEAVKPHNKETINADGSTNIEVEFVPDNNIRLKAVQEVEKIYGLYAPQKKDVTVTVSVSSDAELFAEIDEVTRSRKYVESYVEGEGGFELAPDPQEANNGDFESRSRRLLQDATLQE